MYRVKNWGEYFENHDSRKVKGIRWVPLPNKHDGKGYRRIAQRADGVQVFCAWTLILQVASKMPVRGTLADEDGPLDADDLSAMTGFPADIFELAFAALTEPKIGWLETASNEEYIPFAPPPPETSRDLPALPATPGNHGTEGNRTEGKGIERHAPPTPSPDSRPAAAGGALSKFSFEQVLEWATHEASLPGSAIRDVRAVAKARWRDGTEDSEVERFVNRAPPGETSAPDLTPEQTQGHVNAVVGLMQEGRTIDSISEEYAPAFTPYQWRQIRSAAEAQAKVPKARGAPEPAPQPPPLNGQVVDFASRVSR